MIGGFNGAVDIENEVLSFDNINYEIKKSNCKLPNNPTSYSQEAEAFVLNDQLVACIEADCQALFYNPDSMEKYFSISHGTLSTNREVKQLVTFY